MVEDTVGEIWKPIPGYEGRYEAGSFGNIRSKRGPLTKSLGKRNGRYSVSLWLRGKVKRRTVAVWVAMAFYGERPAGMHCCHIDGNKTNDKITNLKWDAPDNNWMDARNHNTIPKGERHGRSKLCEKEVQEIRSIYLRGVMTQYELAEKYKVHQTLISLIVNDQIWNSIATRKPAKKCKHQYEAPSTHCSICGEDACPPRKPAKKGKKS